MLWFKISLVLFNLVLSANSTYAKFSEAFFEQRIDHNQASAGKYFQQRYFVDSSAAISDKAPVLYFLGHEAELGMLLRNTWIPELAHQLKAHIVALEHRYYGNSQPFDRLTTDNLRYLTFDQALQDFAVFQKYWINSKHWRGPWIAIGKSHGGNLAAFYRQKYANLVVGAVASAPAFRSVATWSEFDRRAAEALGSSSVTKFRKSILGPLETAISHPEKMVHLKKLFDASDVESDREFVYFVGFFAGFLIAMQGPEELRANLQLNEPVEAVATQIHKFLKAFNARFVNFTISGVADDSVKKYNRGIGLRQWLYQCCTQFGGLSVAYPDPNISLISHLTGDIQLEHCKIFGLSGLADVDTTNSEYYNRLLNPATTNILVINGSEDPTATMSISQENGNTTNPNILVHTVVGGAHHSELEEAKVGDSPEVQKAREVIVETIKTWIKK